MDERLKRAARSRAMRDSLIASDPQTQKRMQLDMLRGQGDSMIDMPPPPAAIQQIDAGSWERELVLPTATPDVKPDAFARWQPGMTSSWDPESFPEEAPEGSFVDPVDDLDRAAYLYNAGFTGEELVTMLAISFGENQTGDPWAMGPYSAVDNTGENEGKWQRALGLQQIRPLTDPNNPEWVENDGWRNFAKLLDPEYNAEAAMEEYKQKGFDGWVVYTEDLHVPFLERARETVDQLNRVLR